MTSSTSGTGSADADHQLASRAGHAEARALLAELGQCMRDASICGLGQTASSAIESAVARLKVFADEVTP